ncbi:WhiB family transcriptional regulator [Rhodococcus sp. NPDC127530]|uniref:WhiB family transcriptional regulator n=1 Tax=unclassified Rhodococcus (in: high G+C Gram-positive bacteria) TaxID=192944 RepID=UPI00362E02EC
MPSSTRLPNPNTEAWDWQIHARCRGVESSVFFHPDGERGNARSNRERRAKAICRRCPVLVECRDHALNVTEPFGIWGGLTASERRGITQHGEGTVAV